MIDMDEDDIIDNSISLIAAARLGDINEVSRLIPISNPLYNNSQALCHAVVRKNTIMAQMLAPVSDVTLNHCEVLQVATLQQDTPMIELLYPYCDASATLQYMLKNYVPSQCRALSDAVHMYETQKMEHRVLSDSVSEQATKNTTQRKM